MNIGKTITFTEERINNGAGEFYHPDGRVFGKNGVYSIDVTWNGYSYRPSNYISESTKAFPILFPNTGGYWLANSCVTSSTGNVAEWGLFNVDYTRVGKGDCYYSYMPNFSSEAGARAVVSIKPEVQVVAVEAEA